MKSLRLTPDQREKFKAPIGMLIEGSTEFCAKKLKQIVEGESPVKLILVGDAISSSSMKEGIKPDICIVDNKVMREKISPISIDAEKTIHVSNPPSTIMLDAWKAIDEAIKSNKRTAIIVDGEEDLLTIPAVLLAPEGSIVAYGQPNRGIVIVRVNKQSKSLCEKAIRLMKPIELNEPCMMQHF